MRDFFLHLDHFLLRLKKNDNVFVVADLSSQTINFRTDISKKVYNLIRSKIGYEGTIIVQTYTTYCGREKKDFDYNNSKCTNGSFSQFILNLKSSLRSYHPINSYTAIGKDKFYFCGNNGLNNYGYESPLHRMVKKNCKILKINIPFHQSPLMHYVEAIYCVPYLYDKLLDIKIIPKILNNFYSAKVRYLKYNIEYDDKKLIKNFTNLKLKSERKHKDYFFSLTECNKLINIYSKMIKKSQFAFLKEKPNFIHGKIPFDGRTFDIVNV